MSGLEEQILNSEYDKLQPTLSDFSDLMNTLILQSDIAGNQLVVQVGFGGYMTFKLRYAYEKYGKSKLPRKLKKSVYASKELRKKYLPQYYE
jgi:hypothetical protein